MADAHDRTRTRRRRSSSSPAFRADGNTCAPPSTRWRSRHRVHHVFVVRRAVGAAHPFDRERGIDSYVAQIVAVLDAAGDRARGRLRRSRSAAWSRCGSPRRIPSARLGARPGLDAGPGLAPEADGTSSTRGCRGCSDRCLLAESPSRLQRGSAGRVARRDGAPRIHAPADADVSRSAALGVADGDAGAADRRRTIAQRTARAVACPTLVVHGEPALDHRRRRRRHGRLRSPDSPARASPCSSAPGISARSRSRGAFADIVSGFLDTARTGQPAQCCVRLPVRPARSKRCSTSRGRSRRLERRAGSPRERRRDPRRGGVRRIRTRSSAGRCTPRRSTSRRRRWPGSAARCFASTFAASARARARSTTAPARRTTSAPRSTSCASSIRSAPLWAAGMSFGVWVGLTVGAEDPRVSPLLGVATPVNEYDFERGRREREAEVLHPRRARRDLSAEGNARVLRARRRTEGARGHRRAPIICSTARSARSADAVEDLLGDWSEDRLKASMNHERSCHRFGGANGGRQGAERHAARHAARRARRDRRSPKRCGARRASSRPRSTT